nr:MAG TPA: hypothetical protein [Caudoviricetes sp.]DAX46123.1 MAG TPA: hypothetical protein [Caudoviricetes sp.]
MNSHSQRVWFAYSHFLVRIFGGTKNSTYFCSEG